jgi:hypothetical protein
VILVPGFANDAAFMNVWKRSLAQDGFAVHTFDDPASGLGSVTKASARLDAFIDEVRATTRRSTPRALPLQTQSRARATWSFLATRDTSP